MVPALVAGYHALTSVREWDQFEVVQSKRNNQVVANAMDFTAKRLYMATAGLSQGLKKHIGGIFQRCSWVKGGGCVEVEQVVIPWLVYTMKRSNRKIMFRNNIVGVAALRLHEATKSVEYLGDCCWFLNVYFSIFLRQPHHKVLLGTPPNSDKLNVLKGSILLAN